MLLSYTTWDIASFKYALCAIGYKCQISTNKGVNNAQSKAKIHAQNPYTKSKSPKEINHYYGGWFGFGFKILR